METRKDSTYITKQVKELVKTDTTFVSIINRTERVHPKASLDNSNVSDFNVQLPRNQKSDLQTTEVISWAYWIGVGNEGQDAYQKEKKNFLKDNISSISSMIDPVAGLALGAYTILHKPPKGDNVKYWLTTYLNGQGYSLSQGNSIVASGRVTNMLQGGFTVTLAK